MKNHPWIPLSPQSAPVHSTPRSGLCRNVLKVLIGTIIICGIVLVILNAKVAKVFSGNPLDNPHHEESSTPNLSPKEPAFPPLFKESIYPPTTQAVGLQSLVEYDPRSHKRLCYRNYTSANDVIPDFSQVGYESGDKEIPENIPTMVTVSPVVHPLDDTERIQLAIDHLAKLPADPHSGYRGAVLLQSGVFKVSRTLRITQSGIIVRGDANGNTTIVATGKSRLVVFQVVGNGRPMPRTRLSAEITQTYVPVGAVQVQIDRTVARRFHVGEEIIVERRGNQDWIQEIGMNNLSLYRPERASGVVDWQPFKLTFTRRIRSLDEANGIITLDIPITNSIEQRWGGGRVYPYRFRGRVDHIGVEHIDFVSEYDADIVSLDEQGEQYHSDGAHFEAVISFERMVHGFARNLTARHFNNFVSIFNHAKWVTVENCQYLEPVSPLEGGNRYAFYISRGAELTLFKGNYAEHARHAFIIGAQVTGPNVFYNCTAEKQHGSSEPHHRWSVGGLFDNVRSSLSVQNREHLGSGHGWSGANYVLWNTMGRTVVQKPPTAWNFAIGVGGIAWGCM
ncbi:hypothetical protein K493DRAFT_362390 [Basidiobolus meristosporus CBS 931.73]|uniref:Pectin lyase-like protein n=1 Tax=Basidiobolus meristosporus CBS 931.73 TaxID=1314790 RepID=A0A1Y1X2T7_9FUNG|nr:hypothetical protein K493DRAFT_362390 [Basidiobolus meristosporus CBS 931.73]|eukprot:ORX80093.1 hypothetical protein K493DRAFT_362390 [Basidiobolus meristosporus CBS 931.73]